MGDYYTEQLVKQKAPATTLLIKGVMVLLTVFSVGLIVLVPFAIVAPIIMVVADILVFRSMDVEYEYLYVNGNLDIDKIMAKSKRKRVFETAINDMEIIAPQGAPELIQYQNVKALNYSSNLPGAKVYEMIVLKSGTKKRIIFEPNEVILDGMRMLAPRKVLR